MRFAFHPLSKLIAGVGLVSAVGLNAAELPSRFERINYNHPGLTVDLGAGLWGWPVPCDRNADGRPDLILVAASSPSQGTYYFENMGRRDSGTGAEIFEAGIRLGDGRLDVTASYTPQGIRVLTPGVEHPDFINQGLGQGIKLPVEANAIHRTSGRIRGNQWSYVDYDGNGVLDLIVGVGDWTDYGWDAAYDANGRWTNGPLHGFVYLLKNRGTDSQPDYATPLRLEADHRPLDVFGMPSPVFADFRGTGKLDLICGEFIDGLTFFENIGTREDPRYAPGRRLTYQGSPITLPLAMIVVSAYDWDKDGLPDLIVSQEDGRTALLQNTGKVFTTESRSGANAQPVKTSMPGFKPPRFFQQEAAELKFGVLTTPVSIDWDGDGLDDLVTGNTAGEIAFIKNLGGKTPKWAAPVLLEAEGKEIRILAGYNGSIQGPAEAKWGYNNIGVADWDGDDLPDIVVNTMTGTLVWFKNTGTCTQPQLAAAQPLEVAWPGATPKPAWNWWDPEPGQLVLPWRCTPWIMKSEKGGLPALVTVDHEGYLARYQQVMREGRRILLPGERVFRMKGNSSFDHIQRPTGERDGLLRLNSNKAGASGRRTFCFVDWDRDGKTDLLVNSVNVSFLRNVSTQPGEWLFEDLGPVDGRKLAGHSTSPTMVNWTGDGLPDLLAGAEDGCFYYLPNPLRVSAATR